MLEALLNLLIGIDFAARIKLVGCKKYAKDPASGKVRWWNIFDAMVVTFCNLVFALSLFAKTRAIKGFEEAGEEALIVMWCIWQTMRMILIAKKQRQARVSMKTLIDFENLVVDTDFGGALSFRSNLGDNRHNNSDPDDVIVEMANFEKPKMAMRDDADDEDEETGGKHLSDQNKARLRSRIPVKGGIPAACSGSTR